MDAMNQDKISRLNDTITFYKLNKDRDDDLLFMLYEDLRSQCYEYKVKYDQARENIRQQSETIFILTRDK